MNATGTRRFAGGSHTGDSGTCHPMGQPSELPHPQTRV